MGYRYSTSSDGGTRGGLETVGPVCGAGCSDLEQYAVLLVRVSLGLFFAISGANKLFFAGSTQTMYETLVEAKVPFPHLMAYFVSGVEFVWRILADRRVSFEPGPAWLYWSTCLSPS